ncbi:MAG: gliding motility-associated C-terminal domain-containing protein [Cytophagaceae bacterium]|nr:gliding motility-associated C-terminal domain-containing protein [Cytophagaceae bacterium]MDW8455944.1 gliding motility-associated C-terminal domain-containing protein [Cytophagaceae bacterium]
MYLVPVQAQPPYSACFTVNASRGCAPFTLRVTSCSQSGPAVGLAKPIYYYDVVNAPTSFTNDTFKVYTTPGIYTVRQAVNDGVSSTVYTSQTIEVLATPVPNFTIEGCQGNTVRVRITDTYYDQYRLDYGDGTIVTVLSGDYTTYTYSNSTPKTITVTGEFVPGCTGQSSSKVFTPFSGLVSADWIDLKVISQSTSGSIELRFYTFPHMKYQIEQKINNGSYYAIATIDATSQGVYTHLMNGLNTSTNIYTYRILCMDACGNVSSYSPQLSSMILNAIANNSFNFITLNAGISPVFSWYELSVNSSVPVVTTFPKSDNNVLCGKEYCYVAIGKLSNLSAHTGTNIFAKSAMICTTAIVRNTPPDLANINSTIENNTVKITADAPGVGVSEYSIMRSENNITYKNISTTSSLPFTDASASVNTTSYCYKIQYEDNCDNLSNISSVTCPILLTVIEGRDLNKLSWTSYVGYNSGGLKKYVLEYLDENNNVISSRDMSLNLSYDDIPDPSVTYSIYRIKAEPNGNENLISYSNVVRINYNAEIYIPNIFTPNDDGHNDLFAIKGKYFKDFSITIFNKWGEVVFLSEDINHSWDGTYKGKPVVCDTYTYIVTAKDNNGKQFTEKGLVHLMR